MFVPRQVKGIVREQYMTNQVGLWIDHRQAIIVMSPDESEEIVQVTSNLEKHVRFSGASHSSAAADSHTDTTEDKRDRRFEDRLHRYYDSVILNLRDATAILILGPGEAKYELQKRLEVHGLSDRIADVKNADKLTDNQIVAEVRQYFEIYNQV
jgi:hypothetical protein